MVEWLALHRIQDIQILTSTYVGFLHIVYRVLLWIVCSVVCCAFGIALIKASVTRTEILLASSFFF
jgi:hypothetical protein